MKVENKPKLALANNQTQEGEQLKSISEKRIRSEKQIQQEGEKLKSISEKRIRSNIQTQQEVEKLKSIPERKIRSTSRPNLTSRNQEKS